MLEWILVDALGKSNITSVDHVIKFDHSTSINRLKSHQLFAEDIKKHEIENPETFDKKMLMLHEVVCSKLFLHPELLSRAKLTLRQWMLKSPDYNQFVLDVWHRLLLENSENMSLSNRIIEIQKECTKNNDTGRQLREYSPLTHGLTPRERILFLRGWHYQLKMSDF